MSNVASSTPNTTTSTTVTTKDEITSENRTAELPLENIVEKYERTNKNGNDTEIVLTPKMFKETINEAIMQFARRINLANTVMDPNSTAGFGNKIIKEALKQESSQLGVSEVLLGGHNASTSRDMIQNILSNYTNELQNKTLSCFNETDEECQNRTNSLEAAGQTSDVLRLFEFFSKNKQDAPVNLRYDTNNQLIVDVTPPNTNLVEGDPVRKSIFGENSATSTTDAYGTPHLASATHYMPASSYLNYLTEARKKSLAMHSSPTLSAATPYHDAAEDASSSRKTNAVKDFITHMNKTTSQNNSSSAAPAVYGNVSVVPDSTESKKDTLNQSESTKDTLNQSESKKNTLNQSDSTTLPANSSLPIEKEYTQEQKQEASVPISSDADLNSTSSNITKTETESVIPPQDSAFTPVAKTDNSPCLENCSSPQIQEASTGDGDMQTLKKEDLSVETTVSDSSAAPAEPHSSVEQQRESSNAAIENPSLSNNTVTGSSLAELDKLPADKQPLLEAFINSLREQAASPSSVAIINTSDLQKAALTSTSSPEQALVQTAALIENIPDLDSPKETTESASIKKKKNPVSCPNGECSTKDNAVTRTFYPQPKVFHGPLLKNELLVSNTSTTNQLTKDQLPLVSHVNKVVHEKSTSVDEAKKRGKQYYCQDRPCFSLKDIWKMLHCDHPPCFKNIFSQSKQQQGVVNHRASTKQTLVSSKPTTKVYGNIPIQTWPQLSVKNTKVAREYAHIQTQNPYDIFENPQSFLEKRECACLRGQPTDTKCEERCIAALRNELAVLQKAEVAKPNPAAIKMPSVIRTKSPVIIMLNPNVKAKVEFPDKRTQKRKNGSKICSSWTYYPSFRCLHEYPTYSPIHKPKGVPFDGPYENCRTLQYPPYFKCFSNPLQVDVPDPRHKANAENKPQSNKMQTILNTIKKKLKIPSVLSKPTKKDSGDITRNPVMTSFNAFLMSSVPAKKNLQAITAKQKGIITSRNTKIVQNNQKQKAALPLTATHNNPSLGQKAKAEPVTKMMPYHPPVAAPMKAGLISPPYNYYANYPGPFYFVPYKAQIIPTLSAKTKLPIINKITPLQKSRDLGSSLLQTGRYTPKAPPMHTEAIAKILMGQHKPGVSLATRAKQMLSHQQAWNLMPKKVDTRNKKGGAINSTIGLSFARGQFSTYVNTLLSEKKVEEADLFKKILNVIMASPKSQKYNEAGGDPWQYIFPALKWIEEYETIWKPKYKSEKSKTELKAHEKEKIKKPIHISNDDMFALFEQKLKKPSVPIDTTKEKVNRKAEKTRPNVKVPLNVRSRKNGHAIVKATRILNSSKNVALHTSRKIPSIFKTNKVSHSNEKISSILRAIKALHPDLKISNDSYATKSIHGGAVVIDVKSTKKALPSKSKSIVHSTVNKTVDKKTNAAKSRHDNFAAPNMSKELIKDTLYETSSLLNDLVDEEEIHSLGFTTANTTNILSAKLL